MKAPVEFLTACSIIEGWAWSCKTFEQAILLESILDVYLSPEIYPEEKPLIIEGAKTILLDKIKYQKEKIAQDHENRQSII